MGQQSSLDRDQKLICGLYDLYTSQEENSYLQYTAACVLFYYLTKKGHFSYSPDAPLVYDYLGQRAYIWEDKKFMADINIVRDAEYLIRARARSATSRDVNAHQCSTKGKTFIANLKKEDPAWAEAMEAICSELQTDKGLLQVVLRAEGPVLVSNLHKLKPSREIAVDGFLMDPRYISNTISEQTNRLRQIPYVSYFLNGHD